MKAATKLSKAKNAGSLSNFMRRAPTTGKALATGLAEAAVYDDELGTLGDAFNFGPTQSTKDVGQEGRSEAWRRMKNRLKFGVEGAVTAGLFDKIILPVGGATVRGIGKAIGSKGDTTFLKSMSGDFIHNPKNKAVVEKADGTFESIEIQDGWQFNKNNILRWADKWIGGSLRAAGLTPRAAFDAGKRMVAEGRAQMGQVARLTNELGQAVDQLVDPQQFTKGGIHKHLDEQGIATRNDIMEDIHGYLTTRDEKVSANILERIKGRVKPGVYSQQNMNEVINGMKNIRGHVDLLSKELAKNPLAITHSDDFVQVVADNVGEYLTRSYKAFGADKKEYIANLSRSPEGRSIIDRAKGFIASKNPNYGEAIRNADGEIIGFKALDETADLAMNNQIRLILEGGNTGTVRGVLAKNKALDDAVFKSETNLPPEIKGLLGEVKDPLKQYAESVSKIQGFLGSAKYFQKLKDIGENKFFFNPASKGGVVGEGDLLFNAKIESSQWNPLDGWYTTPEILKSVDRLTQEAADPSFAMQMYNTLLLGPKALTQEAKTTLSPITHMRNVISALAFTGMNGNFFRPAMFVEDFKRAFQVTKTAAKSQLEGDFGKRLFEKGFNSAEDMKQFVDDYQKYQRLGIVNTAARMGDLKKTLDEISTSFDHLTEGGKKNTLLTSLANKFKWADPYRKGARTLYQAEDDIYKIQNFLSEKNKFKEVFTPEFARNPARFIDDAKRFDIDLAANPGQFDDYLDEYAAEIVRNNIPNYDYVGRLVQGLRKLPFGNFVAFPAEVIRTGINTAVRGMREFKDPLTKGIGMQRLGGVALFGLGSGKLMTEVGQAITGVTNEQMNALREYLPEWSQNSDIIPVKQDGQLYFIDYSHINAYDALTRPFQTIMNELSEGSINEENFAQNMTSAVAKGLGELAQPFVSEAIFTDFVLDIYARNGVTKEGYQVFDAQDDLGTKASKVFTAGMKTFLPGSLNQFYRMGLGATGGLDARDRKYKFFNEFPGAFGFRITDPFIEDSIQFKLSQFNEDNEAAKKIITRDILKGAIGPEDAAELYARANGVKLNADRELLKAINAAKLLGMSDKKINKVLKERLSSAERRSIMNNKFRPIKLSSFVKKKLKEKERVRGLKDFYVNINKSVNNTYQDLIGTKIFDNPDSIFRGGDKYMGYGSRFIEGPMGTGEATPLTTTPSFTFDKGVTPANINAPKTPEFILPSNLSSTNTINQGALLTPSDTSQLAKSGDIDITEAIAARRT
tara:strand:- start:1915 stop:5667 length:3753 start_codon:yes stop_codon:yes gene_type:complete